MFELMDRAIKQHQERRGNVEEEEDMVDVLLRLQSQDDDLDEPLTMGTIKSFLRVSLMIIAYTTSTCIFILTAPSF
jgi:hypothetical protein